MLRRRHGSLVDRNSVHACLLRVRFGEYKAVCIQGSIDDMVFSKFGSAGCSMLPVGWGLGRFW
jgi:hypothetical protein